MLTPQLEAQGGVCCVDMVWNNTLGKYVTKNKILIYSSRVDIAVPASLSAWIQFADCIFPRDLVNNNIEATAYINPSVNSGNKGFRIGDAIVSFVTETTSNYMQFNLLAFVNATKETTTMDGITTLSGSINASIELVGTGDVIVPLYTHSANGGINNIKVVEVYI